MADQFAQFKKCITWRKSFECWTGIFAIEKTETCKGMSYSMQTASDIKSKAAKVMIAEHLYSRVKEHCDKYNLDLDALIKQKLAAEKS